MTPVEPPSSAESSTPQQGTDERVWTIVVAGGSGARFGAPKQYTRVGGERIVDRSMATARAASDGVVLVVPSADAEREGGVAGGSTRSESVRAGLAAVPDDATIVLVHDAARPFASTNLYSRVIDAVRAGAGGAIPGVPVADTIKVVGPGSGTASSTVRPVRSTPERSTLVAVQTPQAFRAEVLRTAHADGGDATDDAALVERRGHDVVVVDGEPTNRKITHREDIEWAERHAAGAPAAAQGVAAPVGEGAGQPGGAPVRWPEVRVGHGFDVHRFSDDPTRVLVLGGVVFDGARGLVGHSDADVIAHACADALLGAAGLGDIGQHFPDTDPAWSGADSIRMLAHVVELLGADGWRPSNIDCAVVCEEPKLAPRRDEMQRRLSETVGAPVSIKGNRAEQLGAIGRREGIVGFATALIVRLPEPEAVASTGTPASVERGV